MAIIYEPQPIPASAFQAAFDLERDKSYPAVDAYVERLGYPLERERYEAAARVLSCPVKASPPNWQHGRVIYATWRAHLEACPERLAVTALDIGTAKGYSALCALWAILDSGHEANVHSVDLLPPRDRVRRGTIVETDGLLTLAEILAPWPEAQRITFHERTGAGWLAKHPGRVHLAFVDGKHSYEAVSTEAGMLAERQKPGDVVMFDDCQMPGVGKAVKQAGKWYDLSYLELGTVNRMYAIGVRK